MTRSMQAGQHVLTRSMRYKVEAFLLKKESSSHSFNFLIFLAENNYKLPINCEFGIEKLILLLIRYRAKVLEL